MWVERSFKKSVSGIQGSFAQFLKVQEKTAASFWDTKAAGAASASVENQALVPRILAS